MDDVNASASHAPARPLGLSPVVAGTGCCAVSALGYAGAQICLRYLSKLGADPMWVICNKELVTVVVVGPWLIYRASRGLSAHWAGRGRRLSDGLPPVPAAGYGRRTYPPLASLALLVVVGLVVQMGGNLGVQWALGVVGLAIATPLVFGVMLTASALMGLAFLGEPVSRRSVLAIGLLLLALALLGAAIYATRQPDPPQSTQALPAADSRLLGLEVGGEEFGAKADSLVPDPHSYLSLPPSPVRLQPSPGLSPPLLLALGIGAPCLAGAIYALLTITIRHCVTGAVPISTIVFITTLMGVLSLGPLSLCRLGAAELMATPPAHVAWMLAAGTLNLIAFLAITKGLQLTTVLHVNVLNASQVALAAMAGIALFPEDEHLTVWLLAGVVLTILGVVLIEPPVGEARRSSGQWPAQAEREAAGHA
jgi:DME family drug/metabolite transporter